jgi:hypothetical protein
MSKRELATRSILLTYFPMGIAVLSLVTSIFNGYLNLKFVNLIQHNVGRGEYLRTCKDAIDVYFQAKLRAIVISKSRAEPRALGGAAMTPSQIEGANAVARLGALGTYLANLRDETIRVRYTELTMAVDRAMTLAEQTPPAEVAKLFEPANRIFSELNDDCVKTAIDRPL